MSEISDRELAELRRKADEYDQDRHLTKLIAKSVFGGLLGILLVVVGTIVLFKVIGPKLNLYKANTEKQAVIAEQRAVSEAAEFAARSAVIQAGARAEAMVIEAKSLAESQAIIAATLTPEYVRYLYVKAIEGNTNQVIYIPTEAGLPILEAGRIGNDNEEGAG